MSIFGTGNYTELMLRGQVEGTGTVRDVGSWHWSLRSDVGGDNDDLKLLRFVTGSYAAIAMQVDNSNSNVTFAGTVKSTTFLINLTTAAGIGTTLGDINGAELGPGYLTVSRDDTANAKQISFYKNNVEHSYLETTSSGLNIGNANVYLAKSTNQGQLFFGTADNQYEIFGGGTWGYMGYNTSGYHRFFGSGTERMRITNAGDVGINVTTPGAKLDVVMADSGGTTRQDILRLLQSGQNTLSCYMYGGATDLVQLHVSGAEQHLSLTTGGVATATTSTGIHIRSGGNVGIGTTAPGAKLDVADAVFVGDSTTGTTIRRKNQLFATMKPGPSSGGSIDMMFVDHTHSLNITVDAYINTSNVATGRGYSVVAYGGGTAGLTQTSFAGVISALSISYVNSGGSENYILRVTTTYTGVTAPIISVTAQGQSPSKLRAAV